MTAMTTLRTLLVASSLILLAACGGSVTGGGAFSPSYPDNSASAVASAAREVSVASSTGSVDVAIAVAAQGSTVIGFDASTGVVAYRNDATTNVPVSVAGDSAIIETRGAVRILDLRTGAPRASLELASNWHIIGAGASGPNLAISLVHGTGTMANSRLVFFDGSSVAEDLAVDRPVGVPAIAGSRILVPWAYQHLSVLDFDGNELARVRLRNGVVGHAIADRGRVWFGAASLYRFSEDSANDSPSGYTPPDLGIERAPTLLPNAYETPAPLTSAGYKVRLAFAADPASETLSVADGTLYLVHYRFLFALDATTAETRWVRVLPSDAVGLRASVGGVRVATETGEILTLRASDGRAVASGNVGERLLAVTFPYLAQVPTTEPIESERPEVRAQLFDAIQTADARLVTAREYALSRLAALPDDDATSDLGVLCEDVRLPERTRARACELLSGRATGAQHVESQLRRHGSYLDDVAHPPVASLARASASMRDRAAAPMLVEQLQDPRTPVRAIPAIASALVTLEYADAAPALAAFLRTYHADAFEEGMPDALGAVAEAYARLGGEPALAEVETLGRDPLAPGPAATAIRGAASRIRDERRGATETTQTTTQTQTTPPPPVVPNHITMDMAAPLLATVQSEMATCLNTDPAHPGSARVIIVVRRDGTVADVLATPPSTTECLSGHIRTLRFPVTRGAGETTRVTTTVRPR